MESANNPLEHSGSPRTPQKTKIPKNLKPKKNKSPIRKYRLEDLDCVRRNLLYEFEKLDDKKCDDVDKPQGPPQGFLNKIEKFKNISLKMNNLLDINENENQNEYSTKRNSFNNFDNFDNFEISPSTSIDKN